MDVQETQLWNQLLGILVLLAAALVLGALMERLKQSAILGYLLAGTLLGPHAFNVIKSAEQVSALAELGVALLLFTIGLEFSWKRLLRMGGDALGAGVLQVAATMAVGAAAARLLGVNVSAALVVGAMLALSSTACVLRLLVDRAELESPHGRSSLSILLVQDLAVVPLVLMATLLSQGAEGVGVGGAGGEGSAGAGGGTAGRILFDLLRAIMLAAALMGVFWLLFRYVVPPLLGTAIMRRNRELPILIAIVVGLGSALSAHEIGLSPALGAFVAGMLLAETPFAPQIRADIAGLRTLLVTLFFAAMGMLGDLAWVRDHWLLLAAAVIVILIGKTAIIWLLLRLLRQPHTQALMTGLCLAQVGEFSFVLAQVAHEGGGGGGGGVLSDDLFMLLVSTTIASLFITPFLVTYANPICRFVTRLLRFTESVQRPDRPAGGSKQWSDHVIIIGFGPAGRVVAEALADVRETVLIIDMNPRVRSLVEDYGVSALIGDAGNAEVLEHAGASKAAVIVVTIPDPAGARLVIQLMRVMAPHVPVISRARYHVHALELQFAGAEVIDEERHVGDALGQAVRKALGATSPTP